MDKFKSSRSLQVFKRTTKLLALSFKTIDLPNDNIARRSPKTDKIISLKILDEADIYMPI